MAQWHKKVVIDTIKAALPFQNTLRRIKRNLAPDDNAEPSNDSGLFEDAIRMVQMLRDTGVDLNGTAVLEFGSGWKPILPFVLMIAGVRSFALTDQERLLSKPLLRFSADYIDQRRDELSAIGINAHEAQARLADFRERIDSAPTVSAALDSLGIDYHVPFDPARIERGSYDVILSRAVLEHVSEPVLKSFLTEFRRMLKPTGRMCHIIDMSDHWEHTDKSISRVNFLRYPEWLFRLTCLNPQNYQNRMRHSQFVTLFRDAGFDILHNVGYVHQPTLTTLETLDIHERFQHLEARDLATVTAHMTLRPAEAGAPRF